MTGTRRLGSALTTPAVLVPLLVAGFWPVWHWYVLRMSDGSDEPRGGLALVAAVVFLPRAGWRTGRPAAWLGAAAATLLIHLAGYDVTPPLVRAALAMTAITFVLPRRDGVSFIPGYALLLLSLPLIASLQYYLGFPLRLVTAWCSAWLLRCGGIAVQAEGTVLAWPGGHVLLDAPCSGIHMLWFAALLSATLAAWHRLPLIACLRLAQRTAALVFMANLLRNVVLFLAETGHWPNPPGTHEAVGLVTFALVLPGCLHFASRLAHSRQCHIIRDTARRVASKEVGVKCHVLCDTLREALPRATVRKCHVLRDTVRRVVPRGGAGVVMAVAVVAGAVGAAAMPVGGGSRGAARAEAGPRWEWPHHFEGRALERAELHPFEAALARDFPGAIAAFSDGERRIVFRHITRATRKVHPIADCLRAAGFTVRTVAARRDAAGQLWAALRAERGDEVLCVRERFGGRDGASWTDASAWFWAACLNPESGPWFAATVFAPREGD